MGDLDAEELVRQHGGVVTARQAADASWSRGSIRAALDTGRLIRLRQGAYTSAQVWNRADQVGRQRLILLAHQRINPNMIGWGLSAAVALGLPLPDEALPASTVVLKPALRPRRKGEPVLRLGSGVRLSAVDQILIDCARQLPAEWGLTVADAAIARGLIGQGDLQPADKVAPVDGFNGPRGIRQARWVLEHARAGVESPLESLARAVIILGGFPEPVIQRWIETRIGSFRVDLLDEGSRLITEADGKIKYLTGDDLWQEKRREDALRDERYEVIRFTMADYYRRVLFWDRYRAARSRGRRLAR